MWRSLLYSWIELKTNLQGKQFLSRLRHIQRRNTTQRQSGERLESPVLMLSVAACQLGRKDLFPLWRCLLYHRAAGTTLPSVSPVPWLSVCYVRGMESWRGTLVVDRLLKSSQGSSRETLWFVGNRSLVLISGTVRGESLHRSGMQWPLSSPLPAGLSPICTI